MLSIKSESEKERVRQQLLSTTNKSPLATITEGPPLRESLHDDREANK